MQQHTRGLAKSGGRHLRRFAIGALLLGAVAVPAGAQALSADLLSGDSFILGPGSRPICRCLQ